MLQIMRRQSFELSQEGWESVDGDLTSCSKKANSLNPTVVGMGGRVLKCLLEDIIS
jgi:hypothetical protein